MNQQHLGTYDPVAAAAAAGYQQPHYQQQQQQQLQPLHAQGEVRQHQQPVVTSPTLRDVLNGRGQGVQRHPGNVKYRTLVFVNKGLYAKCPRSDKMKISKGIVAAVCALSGRFLELDERSGIYRDIGDKKATEKTSQALREGQTKIRKQMYNDEKKIGGAHTYDMSLLSSVGPTATSPMSNLTSGREISAEGYFGYSVQVLESLYHEDEGAILHFSHPASVRPHPARIVASAVPSSSALAAAPTDPVAFGPSADANAAMIARALEQFPGSAPPPLPTPTMPSMLLPPPQQPMAAANAQARASELHPFMGRLTNDSLGRPSLSRITSTSMASMFSFTQLLELARNETQRPTAEDRGSIQSVLSAEIRDLIRLSEPQLVQVESMNIDDDMAYEDKEVNVLFDAQTMKDRVSELRFTDTSRDLGVKDRVSELRFTDTSRDHGGEPRREPDPRLTDSTEFTNYSRTSLMDASVMTIPTEDMSVQTGLDKRKRGSGVNDDRETADLLLRLSTENHWNRS